MKIRFPYYYKIFCISILYKLIKKKPIIFSDSFKLSFYGVMRNFLLSQNLSENFVNPYLTLLIVAENNVDIDILSFFLSNIVGNKIKNNRLMFSITMPLMIYTFVYQHEKMPKSFKKHLENCFNLHDESLLKPETEKLKNNTITNTCHLFHPECNSCIMAIIDDIPNHLEVGVLASLPVCILGSILKRKILYEQFINSSIFLALLQTTSKSYSCIVSNYFKTNKITISIALFLSGLTATQLETPARTKLLTKFMLFQLFRTWIKNTIIEELSIETLTFLVYYITSTNQIPYLIKNILTTTNIDLNDVSLYNFNKKLNVVLKQLDTFIPKHVF